MFGEPHNAAQDMLPTKKLGKPFYFGSFHA